MLATFSAALLMFYAAATAPVEATVRRIHGAAIALHSLDLQMIGRIARTVVPDILYLEYKSLYLELKPSVAARGDARPPGAVRSASTPHQTAVTSAAGAKRHRGRRGSGLKGSRTRRMVDQLDAFKAWLLGNPVNERDSAKTVGARANAYWRLHEKTMARDAKRTGEKRGFSSAKTLASAYRNS